MVRLYGAVASRIQRSPRSLQAGIWLLALLFQGIAGAAEFEGSARGTAAAGFDTNAARAYNGATPAPMATLQLSGRGLLRGEAWVLDGAYDAGGRKFLSEAFSSEDTLVQQASLGAAYRIARPLALGLDLDAKDRRGADRSYTDLSARAFSTFAPDPTVEVRASGGVHRFLYLDPQYSFVAGEGGLSARYRLDRHHAFIGFGDFGQRTYDGLARDSSGNPGTQRRSDFVIGAGVSYVYRGGFSASAGYSYYDVSSNSFGERLNRHRLSGTFGTRLPWELLLLAQGNLQLTAYPDGVFLSPEQILGEDDENHSSLSLKLSRPLTPNLEVELNGAVYFDALARNTFLYFRQVTWLGLTYRL